LKRPPHVSWLRSGSALLLSCALALLSGAAVAGEARHDYSVVIQKQAAGHMNVSVADDGAVRTELSYRDNGRGPDIRERFALDAQGTPVEYEGDGVSTYGAEIREQFKVDGGRLRWRSRVDEGDEAVEPGTLFLPIEATFAYNGEVVRSLLRRPGGRAPIAGGGQLSVERVATLSADGPQGPVPLVLVALTGADATPWYSWHRDDETFRLFAVTWPNFAVVAKGHEAAVETLTARAERADDEWLAQLQQRIARPLPGLTLIRGVRWFDAPAATMRGPADVYLRAGRIADVTPPGQLAASPDHVIDGQGRTLLPGLFDMHAHLWASAAPLHLAAGVTSVRDMGGDNAYLMRLQARLAAGELLGPTVYLAGFIEGESAYASRGGIVVGSVDEGRHAIDWYAARGYRQIKLYNSIQPAWVGPLAAHAKARGLKVSGHVPAFMLAEQAVRAGYDELTHINQVTLNFVTQPGDDPRTLLRFTRIGDDAHRLDVTGPRVRAFLALLKKHGTVVDPTLATFESMFTQQQGQPKPGLAALADHLPAVWRRNLRTAEMDLEGAKLSTYRASFSRMLALTRAMHRAGVPLVAGTDDIPGLALHRELELYVQAGIPALHALRIATWNGARLAGAEHEAGSIARGKVADLVLVDGDPSRRIGDIRRASLVFKGGVAYSPAQLFDAMGFKPLVDGARIETRPAAP
jgi:hypothetical protein